DDVVGEIGQQRGDRGEKGGHSWLRPGGVVPRLYRRGAVWREAWRGRNRGGRDASDRARTPAEGGFDIGQHFGRQDEVDGTQDMTKLRRAGGADNGRGHEGAAAAEGDGHVDGVEPMADRDLVIGAGGTLALL